jgi:hypothetical protein
LQKNRIELKGLFQVPGPVNIDRQSLTIRKWIFGYTLEDIKAVLISMAENAQEPVHSMGNDAALAVLSEKPQLLFNYFKQLFAQVTNPPIDPYRENLVMSLMSLIGKEGNLLDETPEHCHQLKLPHPVLSNDDMLKLRNLDLEDYRACVLPITFSITNGEKGLEPAIEDLCKEAEKKVDEGYSLIILSDRNVSKTQVPIPSLLATSAVHHHLIRVQKRQLTGLIVETGEARDVMHFATLISYGASAVNPYLAFEILAELKEQGKLSITQEMIIEHYITAIKKGLLKVMSKMGVSTIRSYRGAQIMEAVGLDQEFIDKYFREPHPVSVVSVSRLLPGKLFSATRSPSVKILLNCKLLIPAVIFIIARIPRNIFTALKRSPLSTGRSVRTITVFTGSMPLKSTISAPVSVPCGGFSLSGNRHRFRLRKWNRFRILSKDL